MRAVWVTVLLVGVLLAGCSEDAGTTEVDDGTFDSLDTKATDTTGVIRGIVVDATVVPIEAATVKVLATQFETVTNVDGAFAFSQVPPGTYFLEVDADGYNKTQTSVSVVAGVDKPDIIRVLLDANKAEQPYVEALQFDGFIQCSNRFFVIGLATCSAIGFGDDDFSRNYLPDFRPQYVQSELVWESTQFFGEELSFSITCLSGPPCPDGQLTIARHEGASPLLLQINQTLNEQFLIGQGEQPLTVRVFAHGHSATDPPEETVYDTLGIDCIEWPIIFAECIRFGGFGMVLDQDFSAYTHIFNRFEPPEGWRFTVDGPPPQP